MSRTSLYVLVLLAGTAACTDGAGPLGPDSPQMLPSFASGSSGCYTVKFDVTAVPAGSFLIFAGEMTGDLEGTVTIQFDPTSFFISGVTAANSGTATWTVTGGVVPNLTSFVTEFDNRSFSGVDRPGSPATVSDVLSKHRAQSGVQKANLASTGLLNFIPSAVASLHFHGVICP